MILTSRKMLVMSTVTSDDTWYSTVTAADAALRILDPTLTKRGSVFSTIVTNHLRVRLHVCGFS